MLAFADRLCAAIQQKRTPLVVGLDPRWEQLPPEFTGSLGVRNFTEQLEFKADKFFEFCRALIDVVAPLVPAVKPQAAFFEQLGPAGAAALARVVDYAKAKGLLVIMDAKRGDIGSTAAAYALAYLGEKPASSWGCDALTINPYLGNDSLQPFVDVAYQTGSGLFVLVKTSNAGSRDFQEREIDGAALYQKVADQLPGLNQHSIGELGFGAVGAVVGATYPEQLAELRERIPESIFLIPGFGAQGGTAKDVAGGFREDGLGAVINSSRGIIFAHSLPRYAHLKHWTQAVEIATEDAIAEIAAETNAGSLVAS